MSKAMKGLTETDIELMLYQDIPSDGDSIDGLEDEDIEAEVCLNDDEVGFNLLDNETAEIVKNRHLFRLSDTGPIKS